MKNSSIIGIVVNSLSVCGLIYLYLGFYKPRQEVAEQFEREAKIK